MTEPVSDLSSPLDRQLNQDHRLLRMWSMHVSHPGAWDSVPGSRKHFFIFYFLQILSSPSFPLNNHSTTLRLVFDWHVTAGNTLFFPVL